MTTTFTIRDFFMSLLVGAMFIVSVNFVFGYKSRDLLDDFIRSLNFLQDFSILKTMFLISVVYLIGHIIGFVSYQSLKLYKFIDKQFKSGPMPMPKWKYGILMFFQTVLYRQRTVYGIIQYSKSENTYKPFKTVDDFWILCAELQKAKMYDSAQHWYLLNELFNSLNLVFLIAAVLSMTVDNWFLGVIYLLLGFFSFKRAQQYANLFVETVVRLKKVQC